MNSKVTTFYSYKGGSGRSMTMANVAWALATNGEKVLTIDWDLEAPGLHRYFHPFLQDPSQISSVGLVDYLWSYIGNLTGSSNHDHGEITPESLVQELHMPIEGAGVLHFIGAGMQDDHYSDRVGGLEWGTFYSRFGGETFLSNFMAWARSRYTHILIDSRTGVADSAGVCTMQLPDAVIICAVYNRQSIEGTAAVIRSIVRSRRERQMQEVDISVVPSRVEDRNNIVSARLHCVKQLKDTMRTEGNLAAQLRASEIKHYPWCSFEEKLAVFEEVPSDSGSLLQAMHRLASRIAMREISPVEVDSNLLMTYWRRAAFEDPRLAELEILSNAPDSETVSKLVHWLEEALSDPRPKSDWIATLGFACVKQANALGDIEGHAAQFLSDQGFEFAKIAYMREPRAHRSRFAYALQARADFLQRTGHLEEALEHTQHAIKLLDAREVSAPWKRARVLERLAELTAATRGPEKALPIYEQMVVLFNELDVQILPVAAIDDAFRAQRLLAEVHVRLGNHGHAFDVVEKALKDVRRLRHVQRRPIPEAAHLLGLYAEIASVLFPSRLEKILADVRMDAETLIDSPALSTILRRKLALVESSTYVRRNQMENALNAITFSDIGDLSKALMTDLTLDETWDAQVELRLSLKLYSEARELLTERIRHSVRVPSPRLFDLILDYVKMTRDPEVLFELVVKRTRSGLLDPVERKMLNQVLSRAREFLGDDNSTILRFLQDLLERADGRSLAPHLKA